MVNGLRYPKPFTHCRALHSFSRAAYEFPSVDFAIPLQKEALKSRVDPDTLHANNKNTSLSLSPFASRELQARSYGLIEDFNLQ